MKKTLLFLTILNGCAHKEPEPLSSLPSLPPPHQQQPLQAIVMKTEPFTKAQKQIKTSSEHNFIILTIDPSFYPKETRFLDLAFNGMFWHRYKIGERIWLVKVSDLPNSVVLTPLDAKGNRLESDTAFAL
jgi:hypothetical protein